ncbi:MAG: hypothetical protein E7552_04785 [Ruminococcaceae bacterium]|nr:hypothetical protein [Oscillospiraceae bacterium]
MRRLLALLCVLALLGGLSACRKDEGASFRFPLSGEPTTLDPQTAADDAARTVAEALFEGFCRREDGKILPAAAEWTVSDDGCGYTFSLKKSLWSDGVAVTADDFVFGYERTAQSPVFAKVSAVVAADDTTVQVTLHEADAAFLSRIADGGWYPCRRDFFTASGGAYGMEGDTLVTNGPFLLKRWEHGRSLLLYRHEGYHAVAQIAPSAVRFVIGAEQTAAALADGTLDVCRLNETTDLSTVTVADTLQYLWFNTTVLPFNTAAVRRAFRDAVDWQTVTPWLTAPTASFVSPAASVDGKPYSNNLPPRETVVDRAAFAAALNAAGVTAVPALTLLCEEGENAFRLAQYIAQSWQKHLGVYLSIEQVAPAGLSARLTAGNYTVAIAPQTAQSDSPADALALFAGESATHNRTRLRDAAFESALATAASLADWQAAELLLHDLCPAVPLTVAPRTFGFAAGVQGVRVTPFTDRLEFRHATRTN